MPDDENRRFGNFVVVYFSSIEYSFFEKSNGIAINSLRINSQHHKTPCRYISILKAKEVMTARENYMFVAACS